MQYIPPRYTSCMRLHHQTGTATLIQFIIGSGLAFISGINSIISNCAGSGNTDCVSNTFVSLLLLLLVVGGYGVLAAVGSIAWMRRSSRLAIVLIGMELAAGVVFLFDAKQSLNMLDRIVNALALLIALWVAYIACNLFRSKGARVVKRQR